MRNARQGVARMVRHLADLTPDPHNANRGTVRGREALDRSLREYGAGRAVLIDRHGCVIAGNKTVEQAKRLNIPLRVVKTDGTHLIAVQRDDLDLRTDPRAKALAIADNRVGELDLEWDIEMLKQLHAEGLDLSAFWTEVEFAALLAGPSTGLTDENAVIEPGPTDIVRGELVVLGRHRLLCGDATSAGEVARLLDGAAPVLMATDPPYGVSYDPAWRHRVNPSQRTAVGRVMNDDRAEWTPAWTLFPGRRRLRLARGAQSADRRRRSRSRGLQDSQSDHLAQTTLRPQSRRLSLGTRTGVVRRPRQGAVARRSTADHGLGRPQSQPDGRHAGRRQRGHRDGTQKPVRLFEIGRQRNIVFEPVVVVEPEDAATGHFSGGEARAVAADVAGQRVGREELRPTGEPLVRPYEQPHVARSPDRGVEIEAPVSRQNLIRSKIVDGRVGSGDTRRDMLLALAATLRSALKTRHDLVLENLALRHQVAVLIQLDRRPRFRLWDRLLWIGLHRLWAKWRQALVLVQPATVVRWHRECFRRYCRRKSQRLAGRPPINTDTRALVRRMATANPLWGAPRIQGELLKLGIEVSERTVSRYLPKRPGPPSQSWRAFLTNHVGDFTVPTLRCQILFGFLVLSHDRRRVLHVNVTGHPTAAWTARQIIDAFPWNTAPRYLLRDRDAVYSSEFRRTIGGLGIEEVVSTARSPWQSPYVERLIGSIRRECLDHIIVRSERHLRCILATDLDYCNDVSYCPTSLCG
jgi:putative transposase